MLISSLIHPLIVYIFQVVYPMYKIARDSCEIQPWKYLQVDSFMDYNNRLDDLQNFTAKSPSQPIYQPRSKIMTKKKSKFQQFYQRQRESLAKHKMSGKTMEHQFSNSKIKLQLNNSKSYEQSSVQKLKQEKVKAASKIKQKTYSQQRQTNSTTTQKGHQDTFIKSIENKSLRQFTNLIIKNVQIHIPQEKLTFSEFVELKKQQCMEQRNNSKNGKILKILYVSKQKCQILQIRKNQVQKLRAHQFGKSLNVSQLQNDKLIEKTFLKNSVIKRHRSSLSRKLMQSQDSISKIIRQKRKSALKLNS